MTTITHLLDTSAWLAHLYREPGSESVSTLLLNPAARVGVAAFSLVEVHARMRALGASRQFDKVMDEYRHLFTQIVPVDESVALRTVALRRNAGSRVPAIDSMIAATASLHDAILVHRDAHFLAIPDDLLKQEMVGGEG